MVLAQIDWGSVPDWLGGAGSVMALIFAFYAVRAAHRANVQQGLQLKALEEDRTQAQASKVAVWCIRDTEDSPSCRIRNASDLPIFSVIVCIAVATLTQNAGHGGGASNRWIHTLFHPERSTSTLIGPVS